VYVNAFVLSRTSSSYRPTDACQNGGLEVVQHLLCHGARPDFRDAQFRTAVYYGLLHPRILWHCEDFLRRHRSGEITVSHSITFNLTFINGRASNTSTKGASVMQLKQTHCIIRTRRSSRPAISIKTLTLFIHSSKPSHPENLTLYNPNYSLDHHPPSASILHLPTT
jgi:hypothetical protein